MNTTVYLIRHSEPFKIHKGIEITDDDFLTINKKTPLSINGEHLAEKISKNKEFSNIDVVWSSDYVRAMSTAKYFAFNNGLKVNINSKFGERVHGVKNVSDIPSNFEKKQVEDLNYKLPGGECGKEVQDRMYKCLFEVINNNKGKRILIVSHGTALLFLLWIWCDIALVNDKLQCRFDNKIFHEGPFNFCEIFKLEFDNNNKLISINNIM